MKQNEKKFEAIITELETIVTELEGSIGLEESLKKFEQGMVLAKMAEDRLKTIENQFQKIQREFTTKTEVYETIEQSSTVVSSEVAKDSVSKGNEVDLNNLPF